MKRCLVLSWRGQEAIVLARRRLDAPNFGRRALRLGTGATRLAGAPALLDPARIMSESVVSGPTLAAPPSGPGSGGDLPPHTVIDGRYSIVGVIGRGGMATVYEALEISAARRVAIKVLSEEFASNAQLVARFRSEVSTTAEIGHANIISIYSFGFLKTASAQPYFAMEYLATGESLEARLRRGPLSPADARKPLDEALRALEAIHNAGVIHRDLKPDNLWLRSTGREVFMKVLDFGIAKLPASTPNGVRTREGTAMGTPQFMSPEQWLGKDVDHRTDIYAMGAVLFATFTGGKLPFDADTQQALMGKILTEAPALPSQFVALDAKLERLILRCLEREPAKRPQSARELRLQLDAILSGLEKRPSKRRIVGFVVAATVVATAVLSAGAKGRRSDARAAPESQSPIAAPLRQPTSPPIAPAIPSVATGSTDQPEKRAVTMRRTPSPGTKPQPKTTRDPVPAVPSMASGQTMQPTSPYRER
jgi:serine/threonine-protein kinase